MISNMTDMGMGKNNLDDESVFLGMVKFQLSSLSKQGGNNCYMYEHTNIIELS